MRKAAAFLLLAVLLYIQGVKVFHRHGYPAVKAHKAALLFKTTHTCTICDYHMAKDAELPPSAIQLQVPELYERLFTLRHSFTPTGISSPQDSRGPPALL